MKLDGYLKEIVSVVVDTETKIVEVKDVWGLKIRYDLNTELVPVWIKEKIKNDMEITNCYGNHILLELKNN